MNKYEQMSDLIEENNGYLFTEQVEKAGISRTYLAKFVRENNLEQVAKGIYISQDTWADELYILQIRNPKIIYAGETALYLHGMIDREYTDICITVPPRFNQTRLRNKGVVVHQEKSEIYQLGMMEVETNYGNLVRTYDKERCICDIIRSKGRLDQEQQLKIRDEIMKYVEMML